MAKQKLNALVTKADHLYTSMEDENGYDNTQDLMDDTKEFLDDLINYLESVGGKVEGVEYETKAE